MGKIYKVLLSFVCFLLSFTVNAEQTTSTYYDIDQSPDELADLDTDDVDESEPDADTSPYDPDPYDPNNYDEMVCAYGPGPCSITIID